MSYFSKDPSNKVFTTTMVPNDIYYTDDILELLKEHHITHLPALESYSATRPMVTGRSIRKLQGFIKKYKIDLLHVMFASPYGLWINHVDIPSLITTRGSDILIVIPSLKTRSGLPGLKDKIQFYLTRNAFRKSSFITSTSANSADAVKRLFGLHSHLIRTGVMVDKIAAVDTEKHLPDGLKGLNTVFFPRSVLPLYEVDMQLDALALLPEDTLEKYVFVFVRGMIVNRDYQDRITAKISAIPGLQYRMYDTLTQQEMWAVYKTASLTVMTPKSDGTPNSALEAMSAKCPLILGDFAYDDDLFHRDYCRRMTSKEPSELRDMMLECLDHYAPEMLQGGYENTMRKAYWQNEMEKLHTLYQEALNQA